MLDPIEEYLFFMEADGGGGKSSKSNCDLLFLGANHSLLFLKLLLLELLRREFLDDSGWRTTGVFFWWTGLMLYARDLLLDCPTVFDELLRTSKYLSPPNEDDMSVPGVGGATR